jgi:hypothetical protein
MKTNNNNSLNEQEYRHTLTSITLEYIRQFEAGEKPDLAAYRLKYPEFVDELAANIAYYHLEGREILEQLEQD